MSTVTVIATAAAESTPAGGAALGQVIGASAVGAVLTAVLLVLGLGHRAGRTRLLARAAALTERQTGLPGWAALPALVAGQALLVAAVGMYWDISLHIDNGRDPGPLANPAHYLILLGLFGLFAAGFLALVLPTGRPGAAAVELTRRWQVPVGGIVLMACGAFALIGFPLDDVSHRLFGQDVTLWGPTHLMLIGGAGLSLFGVLMLLAEGRQASQAQRAPRTAAPPAPPTSAAARLLRLAATGRVAGACGGLLVGMSVYQGEFDFGVPQFRLLFQPVLIAVAAALALTCARLVLGRGGALAAVVFFLVVRGGIALFVGGILGHTTPHFPLYVVEGLVVEGVAAWLGTRRALRFGLVSGLGVGTVGTLAEYAWSHAWMPLPWPAHLLPTLLALTVPAALAGGAIGTFAAGGLLRRPDVIATPAVRRSALAGVLAIAAIVAVLAPTRGAESLRAAVSLVPAGPGRVVATVRFSDPARVRDADWLRSMAWQGRAPLHDEPLRALAPGVYRSAPMPVGGTWKTMLRLHRGRTLAALPVGLPADSAIPAAAVPPLPRFTRSFVPDSRILQRERRTDVPAWLWGTAGLVVLALFAALITLMGWAFMRVGGFASGPRPPAALRPVAPPTAVPAGAGR